MAKGNKLKINLTDLQFRNLADHIPPDKAANLASGLGLTNTDLQGINKEVGDHRERVFRVLDRWRSNLDPFLIHWRNQVDGRLTERVKLEAAMRTSGLGHVTPCLDAQVTRIENDTGDTYPTVNLSLPYDAQSAVDRQQEIEIRVTFIASSQECIQVRGAHLYRLLLNPAVTMEAWNNVCQLKSVFLPYGRVSNIEIPPLCFTVDVVSLDSLQKLNWSIANGELETRMRSALAAADDESGNESDFRLELDLNMESFDNAVRFYKDLNPMLPELKISETSGEVRESQIAAADVSVWNSRSTAYGIPPRAGQFEDSGTAHLVWRNLSQQQFGFSASPN